MKILMIASLYKPYNRGGAEVVFENLVNELKKEHDISILTIVPWSGFRSLKPSVTQEDGVTVYRYYPLNIFSFIYIIGKPAVLRLVWHVLDMFNLHAYLITRSLIARMKPDVVMTHNIKGVGYTVPSAIRSMHVPHVHTLQDIQLLNPSGLVLYGEEHAFKNTNILVRFYEKICRRLFGSPSVVVFASQYLRDLYQAHGFFKGSRTVIIPNPLPDSMMSLPDEQSKRNDSITHFAFFGQLESHKGILFLIDAFKKWKRDDVRLHIGSRGSLEKEILARIADDPRIIRVGFVDDLAGFLKTMHYLIVPSLCYENSPMITFEALAQGAPVIVSNIGGAGEPIEDGVNGFHFTPGDTADFIHVLDRAVVERDQYAERSDNARASVRGYSVLEYSQKLFSAITPITHSI